MKSACLAFAVLFSLCSAAAAEQVYECQLKAHSRFGWIAPVLLIVVDEKTKAAAVFDGIIKSVVGEPITARYSPRDKNSFKLEWTLRNVPLSNSSGTLNVQYMAILRKNTGLITVTAFLSGGPDMDPPRGSGTCKRTK